MNAPIPQPLLFHPRGGNGDLAAKLRRAVAGAVLFDPRRGDATRPTRRSTRSIRSVS
jgi:hypothetical protein